MSEEVIKEIVTSTPTPAELKSEDHLINSSGNVDGDSVPSDLNRKEKPAPRYLRASTGSCHDNCKFGIQHLPESRKYWPVPRRRQDHVNTGNEKRDWDEIVPQRGRPRNKDKKLEICHVKDGTAPAKPEFTNTYMMLYRATFSFRLAPKI